MIRDAAKVSLYSANRATAAAHVAVTNAESIEFKTAAVAESGEARVAAESAIENGTKVEMTRIRKAADVIHDAANPITINTGDCSSTSSECYTLLKL